MSRDYCYGYVENMPIGTVAGTPIFVTGFMQHDAHLSPQAYAGLPEEPGWTTCVRCEKRFTPQEKHDG